MQSVSKVGLDLNKPLNLMNLGDAREMTTYLVRESNAYATKLVNKGLRGDVTDSFVRKIYPEDFAKDGSCTKKGEKRILAFFQQLVSPEIPPFYPTIGDLENAILKRHGA